MTPKQLRALVSRATPGPWHRTDRRWRPAETMGMRAEYKGGYRPAHEWDHRVHADALDMEEDNAVALNLTKDNATLIAALRNNIEALLDVAEAAEEVREDDGGWDSLQRLYLALDRLSGGK